MGIGENMFVAVDACSRPMRLGEYAELVYAYLGVLAQVDPIFASGKVWAHRKRKSVPFALEDPDPIPHLIDLLDKPVDHDYIPPMAYSDRDEKGRATAASTHPLGIGFTYEVRTPAQSRVRILVYDGGWGKPTEGQVAHIDLPEMGDPSYRSSQFAESLLHASVAYWKAAWAEINLVAFSRAVRHEGDGARIGWRTYIGDPQAIKRLPGDVLIERIAPGGVLVKLHGEAFDPADPAQIAEARRIRAALVGDGAGALNFLRIAPDAEVIGRGLPEILG